MKLMSFDIDGRIRWGVVTAQGAIDGLTLLGGRFPDLLSVIAEGGADPHTLCGAALREEVAARRQGHLDLGALRWCPPIVQPQRILCVGLNYRAHVEEVGRQLPPEPSLFVRLASTLVAHQQAVELPRVSECLDFEGELAVVIGRAGRHIPEAQALSHVAGYSLFNDVSVRDYQKHSVSAGKNFHATGPFGPCLLTADEVPDPSRLELTTRLNGVEVQRASVSTMRYAIPFLISYVSRFTPLSPGDVIATGTPAGVGAGRQPPLWLRAGDRIDVEVQEVGILSNVVAPEPA